MLINPVPAQHVLGVQRVLSAVVKRMVSSRSASRRARTRTWPIPGRPAAPPSASRSARPRRRLSEPSRTAAALTSGRSHRGGRMPSAHPARPRWWSCGSSRTGGGAVPTWTLLRATGGMSYTCAHVAPASAASPRSAPQPRHSVGGSARRVSSSSASPACFQPPRPCALSARPACDLWTAPREDRRAALRSAAAPMLSFDVGIPEFEEVIPSRRFANSAFRRPAGRSSRPPAHPPGPPARPPVRPALIRGRRLIGRGHPTMIDDQPTKINSDAGKPDTHHRSSATPANGTRSGLVR